MATWIRHRSIAENLLEKIAALDEETFVIGSFTTDSGIPDDNWENFDPSPCIAHIKTSLQSKWKWQIWILFEGIYSLSKFIMMIKNASRFFSGVSSICLQII